MSIEERYRGAVAAITGRGPVTGLMLFGDGLVIFWKAHMESWGPLRVGRTIYNPSDKAEKPLYIQAPS